MTARPAALVPSSLTALSVLSVLSMLSLAPPACSSRGIVADAERARPGAVVDAAALPAPTVPLPADLDPDPAADRPDGGTVTIKLLADPRRQAHVFWGRRDLGVAPLEITRPRGSGPLDLTVLAPDCLPLHTRAFTDRDDTLSLRLYGEREASGLPGFSTPAASVSAPAAPNKTRRQF